MKYSFRQLEVFLATAEVENITLAAKRLAMSQSAASGALREFEQQFDIQLFDRIGKRLKLNEFGELIRPQALSLIEQAQALQTTLQQHSDVGQLKVGATLTIGNYLAIGIMTQFMQRYPKAKVSLEVANTAAITQKVLNFELDIGLIEGELQQTELDVIPWRDDELIAFCSPRHPLAKQGYIDEEQLTHIPWILRETGSGTRQTFEHAMHGILPQLSILMELQHTEGIKRAVEACLGVGCLSKVAMVEAFERGSLVPLEIPQRNLHRTFHFILHRQKYRSAGINNWIDLCQQQTGNPLSHRC